MDIRVRPEDGEKNLLVLLQRKGIAVYAPCGGNGDCGKCRVLLDGKPVLACRTEIEKEGVVTVADRSGTRSESGVKGKGHMSGKEGVFVLDIGTTTLALTLTEEGNAVETVVFDNPQTRYGSDVLSRIRSCAEKGVDTLRKPLLEAIRKHALELENKYLCHVKKIVVCGNTTMLHIFWGESPVSMGSSPYTPRFLNQKTGRFPEFGDMEISSLPCVSAFIGADTVAGIVACDPPKSDGKYVLLIDLGTNAEMALIGREKIYATSAAAGPCFEGGNVSCGMSATDGAVTSFSLSGGKKTFSFLGPAARGLCGSGLIDVIGQLRKEGIINEKGNLTCGIGYPIAPFVYIMQDDVREFQLAKAAVRSALDMLLKSAGADACDVEEVRLAGGISAALNVRNAVLSGLIPSCFEDKCRSVGNSALAGLIACLADPDAAKGIAEKTETIDTGGDPGFEKLFIRYIDFD